MPMEWIVPHESEVYGMMPVRMFVKEEQEDGGRGKGGKGRVREKVIM